MRQRVYGLALGYEDLNDHDQLRGDPLLAMLSGKADVEGRKRRRKRDRGKAGAGKSTLNRLELTPPEADEKSRYKKIVLDTAAVDDTLVNLYIQRQRRQPRQIVLDLDATDDRLHGHQQGRFFHGYYGHYCYLPLYIFIGEHLLCARLRESNQGRGGGSGRRAGTDCQAAAADLARGGDHCARGRGLLPPGVDELVREAAG